MLASPSAERRGSAINSQHRIGRALERQQKSVADGLHHAAAVLQDDRAQQLLVLLEDLDHLCP